MNAPHLLPALPCQPAAVPWPTIEWPEGHRHDGPGTALGGLLDEAFCDPPSDLLGETHAFIAIQGGQLVAERYAAGMGPQTTYPSWSMAKSITHALAGILAGRDALDIHAPALVPEWQAGDDPRRAITLDQLLRMSSGLEFAEDYVDTGVSDVIAMLFGEGRSDTAAYAARSRLIHRPGSLWHYSSGTTNLVSRALSLASGLKGAAMHAFTMRELFTPLGMRSAKPKFDDAGTFIGSSFCYCSARDFARFGLLYLRGGVWEARQLLAEGWADYARTPTPVPAGERLGYGAHWWLGLAGPGSFSANGFEGQYTVLVPQLDLVLVRSGRSGIDQKDAVMDWIGAAADCFRG